MMAKNTGQGRRSGSISGATQGSGPTTSLWTRPNTSSGAFMQSSRRGGSLRGARPRAMDPDSWWEFSPFVLAPLLVGGLWLFGAFDDAPGTRAGLPDPPPVCERGELPRRIYLSNGDHVMTCRVVEPVRVGTGGGDTGE